MSKHLVPWKHSEWGYKTCCQKVKHRLGPIKAGLTCLLSLSCRHRSSWGYPPGSCRGWTPASSHPSTIHHPSIHPLIEPPIHPPILPTSLLSQPWWVNTHQKPLSNSPSPHISSSVERIATLDKILLIKGPPVSPLHVSWTSPPASHPRLKWYCLVPCEFLQQVSLSSKITHQEHRSADQWIWGR